VKSTLLLVCNIIWHMDNDGSARGITAGRTDIWTEQAAANARRQVPPGGPRADGWPRPVGHRPQRESGGERAQEGDFARDPAADCAAPRSRSVRSRRPGAGIY